jgi:subtilisin family serine protease
MSFFGRIVKQKVIITSNSMHWGECMKCNAILLIFSLVIPQMSFCIIDTHLAIPTSTRQINIHFSKIPNDKHQHAHWNQMIEESLSLINDKLVHEGWIAPNITLPINAGMWENIYHWARSWYYTLCYRTHTLKYPNQKNEAFFTRIQSSLGVYTMHIPDGVPYKIFVKYLTEIYAKNGIEFYIDRDARVHVTLGPDIGLEGKSLTLEQLEELKKGTFNAIDDPINISSADCKRMKEALFWHQFFPTTGLRLIEPFWPPAYPYIPHFFSLWQLAPKKGAGANVVVIDTGVAAYTIEGESAYRQNQDLVVKMGKHNLNMVSADGLDPLDQLVKVIKPSINPALFNQEYLENNLPQWIESYLVNNDTKQIAQYLKKNGNPDLVDVHGDLTKEGHRALQEIMTGDNGIKPKNPMATILFTIQNLIKPYQQTVIPEFLPMPRITESKTTFIAGHGSHTFGLIAAQLSDETQQAPEGDLGVVGLAPAANAIMIKAFKDNGFSDKSTLIAALKTAVIHNNADVVNLSLKITDNLDVTEQSSQLFERVVNLIPYLVAASGNNGDPRLPGYTGRVESYPARFPTVAFDVGAFVYKDGKAYIAPFSQYEPGIGPLFVAPGFDILSTGLIPGQKTSSEYVFMAGTSMAAPIMTGFVALMLGEFKELFTREQLLKVCYKSTIKLNNDEDWKIKVILGVLDMRTALFTLHVLNKFKNDLKKYDLTFNIKKKFDQALEAVLYILLAPTNQYAKKYLGGVDFATNFMTYFDAAQKNKDTFNNTKYFIPKGENALDDALQFVCNTLLQALGAKNITGAKASQEVINAVSVLLKKDTIDLFPGLDKSIKRRLEKKETEQYWAEQANLIKHKKDEDRAA